MILLTRLNGPVFALNPDLVERADCTPDTVITLVDGTKYVVAESLPEFVSLVQQYRASVLAEAQHLVNGGQSGGSRNASVTAAGQRMLGHPGPDERGGAKRADGTRTGGTEQASRHGDLSLVEDDTDETDADNVVPLYRRER